MIPPIFFMIHTYELLGRYILIDVESGAVHEIDENTYRLVGAVTFPMPPECPESLKGISDDAEEIWAELYELQETGLLDSKPSGITITSKGQLKALCLHVSHDCNLRCGYCFAGTGNFGGGRMLMTPETACRAIDFLIEHSGNRRNLEVDFFGGEPLLALDTVKAAVLHGRSREPETGKHFRFTMTTNGLLLDDCTIKYLNDTMDNIVLSVDGCPETNDALRKTTEGESSYGKIVPAYKRLVKQRKGTYYIRGTFTHRNLDFVDDLMHLADEGFTSLSLEPVVLKKGHPLAITDGDVKTILSAYERLCKIMLAGYEKAFGFFHFNVDLSQGPCVYKRIKGCGAGVEYAAVTPDGELFPCHQFVGKDEYKLGSLEVGITNSRVVDKFVSMNICSREACRTCWAKYYCSGGCAASNLTTEGDMEISDHIGCELERKRLECAILLKTAEIL